MGARSVTRVSTARSVYSSAVLAGWHGPSDRKHSAVLRDRSAWQLHPALFAHLNDPAQAGPHDVDLYSSTYLSTQLPEFCVDPATAPAATPGHRDARTYDLRGRHGCLR